MRLKFIFISRRFDCIQLNNFYKSIFSSSDNIKWAVDFSKEHFSVFLRGFTSESKSSPVLCLLTARYLKIASWKVTADVQVTNAHTCYGFSDPFDGDGETNRSDRATFRPFGHPRRER